jgi:CDP-glycerol glycerophosphotransferase (TagB/SpsB family)
LAKIIYLDHFIIDYLEYISKSQITIQLWHGIGPKPMQDRSRFSYTYFSSPSKWINETVSKKIFKANSYLNLGYPRNDILLKNEEKLDLLLCDMNIYNSIHKNKDDNTSIVLYMPTFRENGFSAFPLDFKTLNKSMEEQNIKFYVKLHPYVLSKYRDTIKEQTFSNIIFYNTAGDIYPILKYIDILITDYSSIAYDFLLLNKPIIFFNYDYIEYKQAREASAEKEFLLDYEKDTPGQKVQTQIELINEMAKILEGNDLYSEARIEIRNKLFDYTDGNSCSRIYNHIKTNTQGE